MNEDFIQLKSLQGDLKLSHKKRDIGITVSTEELVIQKPHVNYHVLLDDIVSIVPYEAPNYKSVRLVSKVASNHEYVHMQSSAHAFRFFVRRITIHSRSGKHELENTEIVVSASKKVMQVIGKYSNMHFVTSGD